MEWATHLTLRRPCVPEFVRARWRQFWPLHGQLTVKSNIHWHGVNPPWGKTFTNNIRPYISNLFRYRTRLSSRKKAKIWSFRIHIRIFTLFNQKSHKIVIFSIKDIFRKIFLDIWNSTESRDLAWRARKIYLALGSPTLLCPCIFLLFDICFSKSFC